MLSERTTVPGNAPKSKAVFLVDQNGEPFQVTSSIYASVKDYGAKGDGSTDDTKAIQNAIDESPPGATIYFPPGIYIISNTIQLKKSQNYLGGGYSYNIATIKQANNANVIALMAVTEFMINATYSSDPVRLSNLYFDGNSINNTRPPANGGHGIIFMSSDSIIEECWFQDIAQTAIVFSDSNLLGEPITNTSIENHIINCKVDTTGQYGIWVRNTDGSGQCTDGYIRDCIVSSTADTSIFVDRGAGWFLSGNHVYGGQKSAIIVNNAWATSVIGNEIDGYGYSNATSTNYFTGIGVSCLGPRPNVVEANIICTSETNPRTIYQHLSITGDSIIPAYCIVTGNTIMGGYVNVSSSTVIPAPGSHTIIVGDVTNIEVGQVLTIDAAGANKENVVVTAVNQGSTTNQNTITANFSKTHSGTYTITSSSPVGNSTGIVIQSFTTQITSGQPFSVQVGLNLVAYVGIEYSVDGAPTTVLIPSRFIGGVQSLGDLASNQHIVGDGPNAHVTVGADNGANAPAPKLSGNDTRGTVSFGCGTGATAGAQVNVKYAAPYPYYPVVVLSPANAITAQSGTWYVSNITTNGFSVASTQPPSTGAQSANTYSINYHVTG